jgi:hypothetical protein
MFVPDTMAWSRETEEIVLPEVTVVPPRRIESAVGEEEGGNDV